MTKAASKFVFLKQCYYCANMDTFFLYFASHGVNNPPPNTIRVNKKPCSCFTLPEPVKNICTQIRDYTNNSSRGELHSESQSLRYCVLSCLNLTKKKEITRMGT